MTREVYTEEIHARNLMAILEQGNVCRCCPAAKGYAGRNAPDQLWSNYPCGICRTFIGLDYEGRCPCHSLGTEEAVYCTVCALKKKGYM